MRHSKVSFEHTQQAELPTDPQIVNGQLYLPAGSVFDGVRVVDGVAVGLSLFVSAPTDLLPGYAVTLTPDEGRTIAAAIIKGADDLEKGLKERADAAIAKAREGGA